MQTAVILAKTISGTGNFALPFAFLNMGLFGGFITIVGAAFLTAWTLILMHQVKNSRYITERGLANQTYVDIAYAGFGTQGAVFVYFVTVFCLEGVCSVYLNFVSTTAHSLYPAISQQQYLFLTLAFAVIMTMMDSMTFLKYMSGLGIIAVTFTILCVMLYSFENYSFGSWSDYSMFTPETYFRSFGSIAFFFCVNVNAMPIEREMKAAKTYWPAVVTWTCIGLAIINVLYGASVFMLLKESTCGNVVMNLNQGKFAENSPKWLTVLPKLTMIVELTVSYPLILYAAVDIVQRSLGLHKSEEDGTFGESSGGIGKVFNPRNLVNFVMATLPAVFAQARSFAVLVNLVGGFGAALSAYFLPPLLFLKVCGGDFATSQGKIILCVVVAIIGLVMSCITTAYTLHAMWHPFPEPEFCR
mmetsp:Transcript_14424/g.20144  ORF Transcript_14424/g.20144 Transcript_14424/m.20144 type:complete len:415 (+) Transcript_14424:110-1354(+)